MATYEYRSFEYSLAPGLSDPEPRHQVVIVGAGPIGLSMAIDLALKGVACVVLDDNNVVSVGSRAICWAKRTLEIFDRLGVGERMLEKGVTWQTGRVFHGDEEVYNFDLLPEAGHKYPAFINLQQYYVEQYLIERAQEFPELIDLRFLNKAIDHTQQGDCVQLTVETPDGNYTLECEYLLACDGANSPTRNRMDLAFNGQMFDEHFLIIDVEMETSPFPGLSAERWFWFEPTFHHGQSALLHKQPDNVYRIDLQLGFDTDPKAELADDKVLPRLKAILGDKPFSIDWKSVYRFRCARLDSFVHDRVIFVGDSAHVVSPFGARGGNGGIQDVDNLGWKLAMVLNSEAEPGLLDSYDLERIHGADENILNSSRATNFMTPKSPVERMFRDQVLSLSHQHPFARRLINSGRLSVPCTLSGFSLQTSGSGKLASGMAALDAPLADGSWLLEHLGGEFVLAGFGELQVPAIEGVRRLGIGHQQPYYQCLDPEGSFALERYGDGAIYLFRPDAHIAASFLAADVEAIGKALDNARGKSVGRVLSDA